MKNVKPVTPDDIFHFHCARCSDCCQNIEESVPLEALDIYNIVRHMKQTGQHWEIGDFLTQYTELCMITDFLYPMPFIKTRGPDDSCVFLHSGRCGIHNAKPRTCRMYPLTAEPTNNGHNFQFYIITERRHHYSGPPIRVGDWMDVNLTTEDRAFTQFEVLAAIRTGLHMKKLRDAGFSVERTLAVVMAFKYMHLDVNQPFMEQYVRNHTILWEIFSQMA